MAKSELAAILHIHRSDEYLRCMNDYFYDCDGRIWTFSCPTLVLDVAHTYVV